MSTGLDCHFTEETPGKWFLYLEEAYGSKLDPEYDRYGPFATFETARNYLADNFANPGGYGVQAHPDSKDTSTPMWV